MLSKISLEVIFFKGNLYAPQLGVYVKAGLWTGLDWTLDWTGLWIGLDWTVRVSLASQPTSTPREGSGQLSTLPHQNVISYATFGLRLCDRGLISRCSAVPCQSGQANSETSTI